MKLALVRQRYTPYGGAERFLALAIESLGKAGVDVEIIARSWQGTVVARRCDPFYLGRTWRDMSFARCVQRLLRSERYDLVQTHERIPGCHVYRAGDGVHATWLELSAKPWRLSCWHRYTLAAEDALFRAPDLRAVICNSHMVAADIARRWPMAAAKITVIHNGVDLERFHPRLRNERSRVRARFGAREDVPIVLFVGSGYARKGVATLLAALAKLPEADAWIVGKDKDERRYRQLAERSRLSSRVRFFGPQQDVRPFYAAADLFCLPTLYDPLPNAALEALACGLPVITTTTCGAAELLAASLTTGADAPLPSAALEVGKERLTRFTAGAIVPPQDADALAQALSLFLSERAGAADAAVRCVASLSIPAMTQRLLALYARLGLPLPAHAV